MTNNLAIKLLISINILILKKVNIIISKKAKYIKSCKINIKLKAILKKEISKLLIYIITCRKRIDEGKML